MKKLLMLPVALVVTVAAGIILLPFALEWASRSVVDDDMWDWMYRW